MIPYKALNPPKIYIKSRAMALNSRKWQWRRIMSAREGSARPCCAALALPFRFIMVKQLISNQSGAVGDFRQISFPYAAPADNEPHTSGSPQRAAVFSGNSLSGCGTACSVVAFLTWHRTGYGANEPRVSGSSPTVEVFRLKSCYECVASAGGGARPRGRMAKATPRFPFLELLYSFLLPNGRADYSYAPQPKKEKALAAALFAFFRSSQTA